MSILSSVVLQNPAPWRLILDSIQCRDRPNSRAMSFEGQFGTDTLTDERAHPPLVKACACSRYGMVCKAPNVLSSTLAKGLTQNSHFFSRLCIGRFKYTDVGGPLNISHVKQ